MATRSYTLPMKPAGAGAVLTVTVSSPVTAPEANVTVAAPSALDAVPPVAAVTFAPSLELTSLEAAGGDGPLPGTAAGSSDGSDASCGAALVSDADASSVALPAEVEDSGPVAPPVAQEDDVASVSEPPELGSVADALSESASGAPPADVS